MSDSIRAVADDTAAYVRLCKYYKEKPVSDHVGPNPYSKHAQKLKARLRKEQAKKKKD